METSVLKKALRKEFIRRAKLLTADQRQEESNAICFNVVQFLETLPQKPSLLTAYLAMGYEVNVEQLLDYGWKMGIPVAVPHMLPPSSASIGKGGEMLFVEVKSLEDLGVAFAPQGKMNILELKEEELRQVMSDRRLGVGHRLVADNDERLPMVRRSWNPEDVAALLQGHHHGVWSSGRTSRRRSSLLRDLPSESAAKSQSQENHPDHEHNPPPPVVMIVPASGFDAHRQRIGKGGGYYDRFTREVELAMGQHAQPQVKAPSGDDETAVADPPSHGDLLTIGVAFHENVLQAGETIEVEVVADGTSRVVAVAEVAVEPHDRSVTVVATPSALLQ